VALLDSQCCVGARVKKCEQRDRQMRLKRIGFDPEHSGFAHVRESMAVLFQL